MFNMLAAYIHKAETVVIMIKYTMLHEVFISCMWLDRCSIILSLAELLSSTLLISSCDRQHMAFSAADKSVTKHSKKMATPNAAAKSVTITLSDKYSSSIGK